MGDTVSIIDLRVDAVIGVFDWERETEQSLVFNIDMASDVAKAAGSDNIADALDYSKVAGTVKSVVTRSFAVAVVASTGTPSGSSEISVRSRR